MIGHPEYMNEAQIKEMADSGLVKFECHTASHPSLANLSDQQAEQNLFSRLQKLRALPAKKLPRWPIPQAASTTKLSRLPRIILITAIVPGLLFQTGFQLIWPFPAIMLREIYHWLGI